MHINWANYFTLFEENTNFNFNIFKDVWKNWKLNFLKKGQHFYLTRDFSLIITKKISKFRNFILFKNIEGIFKVYQKMKLKKGLGMLFLEKCFQTNCVKIPNFKIKILCIQVFLENIGKFRFSGQ